MQHAHYNFFQYNKYLVPHTEANEKDTKNVKKCVITFLKDQQRV